MCKKKAPALAGLYSFDFSLTQSRSRRLRSCSERVEWRSFRRALTSVWWMRSRVTANWMAAKIDLALLADTQISGSLELELIEADFVPLQQRIIELVAVKTPTDASSTLG